MVVVVAAAGAGGGTGWVLWRRWRLAPHIGIIVEAARGEGWGVRFLIYLCTRKISVETIRSQSDQTGT